jgi:hypothetical protein
VVQIRCLYEGVGVQQMLDAWHEMLPAKMQQWGLDRNKVSVCGCACAACAACVCALHGVCGIGRAGSAPARTPPPRCPFTS